MTALNESGMDAAPSLPSVPADGKFRVLVVEDDPNIARLVLITLAKSGFEARHAPDGTSAVHAFKVTDPHLVVLDLNLPGMDGRAVCQEIRKVSMIPVVVMTASDSEAIEVQSFKLGADDFVTKPFNPQLLLARIVANLRRTYRYDAATPAVSEPAPPAPNAPRDLAAIAGIAPMSQEAEKPLPVGWAKCDSCDYMGPRSRFEAEDGMGRVSRLCPNCKQSEFVTFSIG